MQTQQIYCELNNLIMQELRNCWDDWLWQNERHKNFGIFFLPWIISLFIMCLKLFETILWWNEDVPELSIEPGSWGVLRYTAHGA